MHQMEVYSLEVIHRILIFHQASFSYKRVRASVLRNHLQSLLLSMVTLWVVKL